MKNKLLCATSVPSCYQQVPSRHKKSGSKHRNGGPGAADNGGGGNNNASGSGGGSGSGDGFSHLFVPVPVKNMTSVEDASVGIELAGKLNKQDVLQTLNRFFRRSEVKLLSAEHGLDSKLFL